MDSARSGQRFDQVGLDQLSTVACAVPVSWSCCMSCVVVPGCGRGRGPAGRLSAGERNRYHGVDGLTQKYIGKAEQMALTPPEDKNITTLYVGLMGQQISEKDLSDQFYAYGELKGVQMVPQVGTGILDGLLRAWTWRRLCAPGSRISAFKRACI